VNVPVFPLDPSHSLRTPMVGVTTLVGGHIRRRMLSWVNELAEGGGDIPDIDPYHLLGGCAMASWTIQKTMELLGLPVTLVRGHFKSGHHCWVTIGDVIVDVTATQFGIDSPVYVTTRHLDGRYVPLLFNEDAEEEFMTGAWQRQSPILFKHDLSVIALGVKALVAPMLAAR
jgi:hypothetical protein